MLGCVFRKRAITRELAMHQGERVWLKTKLWKEHWMPGYIKIPDSVIPDSGGKQLLPGSLCHQNTWGLRTGSLFLLNTHGLSLNTSRKCGCIFIDSARFNDLGGM